MVAWRPLKRALHSNQGRERVAAALPSVAKPFADKSWLAALVDEALVARELSPTRPRGPSDLAPGLPLDFAAAARILVARSLRMRRQPPAGTDEAVAFREIVQQHVLLLLDLRLLAPTSLVSEQPLGREQARADLAAFLAGALGLERVAVAAASVLPSWDRDKAVERALVLAGEELVARFFPPGDPRSGLPLSSGAVAVFRRHLARVVGGYVRAGELEPEALQRHAEYAALELALLAEALAGVVGTASAPDARAGRVRSAQMARLGLRGAALREARKRISAPRPPEELARAAPEAMRGFLFEQLLLAQLRERPAGDGAARYVEAFAQGVALDPQLVVAAQVEAAAQSGDPQAWFEGELDKGGVALDWHALAEDWGEAADKVVDRVSTAVTENLGAVATEIRETGELGYLLTKAAAGQRLTGEEKKKVRAQLIDLAKVVPALALFAAPGGSILLPLLVKLLPFNVLPSAWERIGAKGGASAAREPAPADAKPGSGPGADAGTGTDPGRRGTGDGSR